jgi:GNAT superfamily N-acetyltransferase
MFRRLHELPIDETEALAVLARGEGYLFLDRLIREQKAADCFAGPGELLLGTFDGGRLVGIGGLHRDPYAGNSKIARLRRFYIAPYWRRRGIGKTLVGELLNGGRSVFEVVRLKAPDAAACRFYEAVGFAHCTDADATHIFQL